MPIAIPEKVSVIRCHYGQVVDRSLVETASADRELAERNLDAAPGWAWRLCPTNFFHPDGTPMTISEANEIRRACGQVEW